MFYHYKITGSFHHPKDFLWWLHMNRWIHLFLPPPNHWSFHCLHRFALFRRSQSWNHRVCGIFKSVSLTKQYALTFPPSLSAAWQLWVSFFLLNVFIRFCFWQCWVCVAVQGLSSRCSKPAGPTLLCGAQASRSRGFSHLGARAPGPSDFSGCGSRLQSSGSAVVVPRFRCLSVCGISPDQGSKLCLLHGQADS